MCWWPELQHTHMDDASSPTVSLQAMMMSCGIDEKEGRYIFVTDIPSEFLDADMKDTVRMILEDTIAQNITNLYRKYIWHDKKSKPMLYVQLKRALYSRLHAALLFWNLLLDTLLSWGLTINPYNQCVANKTINGRQCTIVWHLDDLQISYVEKNDVKDIIKSLNNKFGVEIPLTTTRGKKLTCVM